LRSIWPWDHPQNAHCHCLQSSRSDEDPGHARVDLHFLVLVGVVVFHCAMREVQDLLGVSLTLLRLAHDQSVLAILPDGWNMPYCDPEVR